MKIYTTTNSLIVKSIQSYFNVINKEVKTIVFSDGEVLFQLNDELVDETIILIQTISSPVNDAIIHTLFLTELIKNACVKNIILVLTYLGYARQDRQTLKFSLVSSKVVCKLLSNVVNRVYVIEPHCSHVLSYFDSSSFGISIASIICEHISRFSDLDDIVIISLDQGGLNRVI
ncbi:ribose-phosphate pyrophosphokinase-like domain-containing protein [Candidatus Hodgkinia cicadicola]